MKLFGDRAIDYLRSAGPDDRRYLLFNPITKMKVTTEGERVIDLLWDVIAAKGFEKDMYFEMAARDIRALPKLEGTVHVNMALVLKFMAAYLFDPAEYRARAAARRPADDEFLFRQGPARGLSKIRFHDWRAAYAEFAHVPNVGRFVEQAEGLQDAADHRAAVRGPDHGPRLPAHARRAVHARRLRPADPASRPRSTSSTTDTLDQIFDVLVRDFSAYAVALHGRASSTDAQQEWALANVRKPAVDGDRFERVWEQVRGLAGAYEMRP